MKVVCDDVPYGAYLKPGRKKTDNTSRAANEKICADFACDVGVPVPPVLLFIRDDAKGHEEKYTAVSLFLSSEVWRLKDIRNLPNPPWGLVESAYEESSGIMAFDTWVGNTDRNNGGNILFFERPDGTYQAAYIDLAFTLNRHARWEKGNPEVISWPHFPNRLGQQADAERVMRVVEAIENFPEEEIRRVVERIPDKFMDEDEKELVAYALIRRAEGLRSVMQSNLNC